MSINPIIMQPKPITIVHFLPIFSLTKAAGTNDASDAIVKTIVNKE